MQWGCISLPTAGRGGAEEAASLGLIRPSGDFSVFTTRLGIGIGLLLSSLLRPIPLCRVVRSLAPWGMFGCVNCVLRMAPLELYTNLNVMSALLSSCNRKYAHQRTGTEERTERGTSERREREQEQTERWTTVRHERGHGTGKSRCRTGVETCVWYCPYVALAPLGFVGVVWILWD